MTCKWSIPRKVSNNNNEVLLLFLPFFFCTNPFLTTLWANFMGRLLYVLKLQITSIKRVTSTAGVM